MIPLALDPGKMTGWAVPGSSGAEQIERNGDGKMPLSLRHGTWFGRARAWVSATIDRHGVEMIVLERQPVIRGNGSLVTLGLRGVYLEVAWSRRLMVDEVAPSKWQAWAKSYGWRKVGAGNGGDEIDAVAILEWWQAIRLPEVKNG